MSFAVIHVTRQRPICIVIWCRRPSWESIGEKDVIGDKNKNAQDAREIFEAMQERVPSALNCIAWSRRKAQFNGLDQKLYER